MSTSRRFEDLPRASRLLLPVLILLVLSILFYLLLYQPLAETHASAVAQEHALEAKLKQSRQVRRQHSALTRALAARSALDQRNLRVLPETAEMATFLQDLHRAAERHGVQLSLVEPRADEPQARYVRLPVALKMQGSYNEITRFFAGVSQLGRAINMENVQLSRMPSQRGGASQVRLQVEVLATTFRLPSPEAQTSAANAVVAQGQAPRSKATSNAGRQ